MIHVVYLLSNSLAEIEINRILYHLAAKIASGKQQKES